MIASTGVRPITLHDIRHTHATRLLRRGIPVHVVSRRFGRANEAITLTTYAHVLPDQGRLAADVAGAIATRQTVGGAPTMPEQSDELYTTAIQLIPVLLILVVLEMRLESPGDPRDKLYRSMAWMYVGTIFVGCLALVVSVVVLVSDQPPRLAHPSYRVIVKIGLPLMAGLAAGFLFAKARARLGRRRG